MLKIVFDRETRTATIELEDGTFAHLEGADVQLRVEFQDGMPSKKSVMLTGHDPAGTEIRLVDHRRWPPAERVQFTEVKESDLRPFLLCGKGPVGVVGNYQLREFLPQERLISAGPRREV